MTRDRDHWDREGGPGEVKGSKSSTGKPMTRDEVDALEKAWDCDGKPSARRTAVWDEKIANLFATVREQEAEIERLSTARIVSNLDKIDAELGLANDDVDRVVAIKKLRQSKEQAEAERDRLQTAVQIAEDLLDIEMGPRSPEVVDRAWNVLHDALAPTEPGDAE